MRDLLPILERAFLTLGELLLATSVLLLVACAGAWLYGHAERIVGDAIERWRADRAEESTRRAWVAAKRAELAGRTRR